MDRKRDVVNRYRIKVPYSRYEKVSNCSQLHALGGLIARLSSP